MYSLDQDYLFANKCLQKCSLTLSFQNKANTSNIIIKMYENDLIDFLKAENVKDSSISSLRAALNLEVKLRIRFLWKNQEEVSSQVLPATGSGPGKRLGLAGDCTPGRAQNTGGGPRKLQGEITQAGKGAKFRAPGDSQSRVRARQDS